MLYTYEEDNKVTDFVVNYSYSDDYGFKWFFWGGMIFFESSNIMFKINFVNL